MKSVTLLYHDVVKPGASGSSGFCSADASIYKLSTEQFSQHLDAIDTTGNLPRSTITDVLQQPSAPHHVPVFLTFDDGGASAAETADLLDRRGWKGHFFIPTDFIGSAGFVTATAIRDLHARGHVIGSHSCSHPSRISALANSELQREWRQSVQLLQDIVGATVQVASVPGGFYSARVAEFAYQAGVRVLFNSEPVVRSLRVSDCLVLGRFGLQQASPPELARKFAVADRQTLLRQEAFWNAKKIAKVAGGEQWLAFRKWWLGRHAPPSEAQAPPAAAANERGASADSAAAAAAAGRGSSKGPYPKA